MSTSSARSAHLERLGTALVCDVLDSLGHRDSYLGDGLRPLLPQWRLAGPAVTVRCETSSPNRAREPGADYGGLFDVLADHHDGAVLVIAGAENHSGLWGELLSTAAAARGLAGVVLDGPTRDVGGIIDTGLPVFATGTSPLDSAGRQWFAESQCPIHIGDSSITPGDVIVADDLGVVAVPMALVDEVVARADDKMRAEDTVRAELRAGHDLRTVFTRHGIL